MKSSLPVNHGLPEELLGDPDLVPRTPTGALSLTDVQYEALNNGVARGASMLVVAPTSTGKTLIGVWALTSWLLSGPSRHAVYLVTHRALARQKFEELSTLLSDRHLNGDRRSIVLANGDTVEDGEGGTPSEPLNSPILVATYEKYLAMLAGTGISADMSHCVIVCDEIQILGDEQRGCNIEVLLTLLRKTRWGQLIGLSAVIDTRDARDLKDWFGVTLVRLDRREKHLHYECRTPTRVRTFRTDQPEGGVQDRSRAQQEQHEPTALVHQLARDKSALPIVVFCMTRKRVEEAVQGYARSLGVVVSPTQPLLPALKESTAAARNLSSFIPRRFAFHTADLLEEERNLVEDKLKSSQLDVVFATSTLAAGVNFPFKTAVFDSWMRWNARTRNRDPCPRANSTTWRAGWAAWASDTRMAASSLWPPTPSSKRGPLPPTSSPTRRRRSFPASTPRASPSSRSSSSPRACAGRHRKSPISSRAVSAPSGSRRPIELGSRTGCRP